MELSKSQGKELEEVSIFDGAGQPVKDEATLGASRVLLVAECVAQYLQQLEGMGFGDEPEIQRLTSLMAINVIRAAQGPGKRLAADVRLTARMLGFCLLPVEDCKTERMDS